MILEDTPPPGFERRRPLILRVLGSAVVALLAAFLFVFAVTLQVRGWTALSSEAGGACGGRYGNACPRGEFISDFVSFPVLMISLPLLAWGLWKQRALIKLLMVVCMVGGFFAGQAFYGTIHGTTLSTVWRASYDQDSTLNTEGSWLDGSTLVRIRADQVTGYDSSGGATRWTYGVPGRNVVCALSRTVSEHVGLLGYATDGDACARFVALDLTSGRVLWTTQLPDTGLPSDATPDWITVSGSTAALLDADGLVGLDLRTGAQRWTSVPPGDCPFNSVAGGPVLAAGMTCGGGFRVAMIDPATGNPMWSTFVADGSANSDTLSFVSTDPVTVHIEQPGTRGSDEVVSFDASGRAGTRIPVSGVSGPGGLVSLDTGNYAFDALPVRWAFVTRGVLVGVGESKAGGVYDVLGYRLSDGKRLWAVQLPESVDTIAPDGDKVLVLLNEEPTPSLQSVSVATGALTEVGLVPDDLLASDSQLIPVGNRFALVNKIGINPNPPVVVLTGG